LDDGRGSGAAHNLIAPPRQWHTRRMDAINALLDRFDAQTVAIRPRSVAVLVKDIYRVIVDTGEKEFFFFENTASKLLSLLHEYVNFFTRSDFSEWSALQAIILKLAKLTRAFCAFYCTFLDKLYTSKVLSGCPALFPGRDGLLSCSSGRVIGGVLCNCAFVIMETAHSLPEETTAADFELILHRLVALLYKGCDLKSADDLRVQKRKVQAVLQYCFEACCEVTSCHFKGNSVRWNRGFTFVVIFICSQTQFQAATTDYLDALHCLLFQNVIGNQSTSHYIKMLFPSEDVGVKRAKKVENIRSLEDVDVYADIGVLLANVHCLCADSVPVLNRLISVHSNAEVQVKTSKLRCLLRSGIVRSFLHSLAKVKYESHIGPCVWKFSHCLWLHSAHVDLSTGPSLSESTLARLKDAMGIISRKVLAGTYSVSHRVCAAQHVGYVWRFLVEQREAKPSSDTIILEISGTIIDCIMFDCSSSVRSMLLTEILGSWIPQFSIKDALQMQLPSTEISAPNSVIVAVRREIVRACAFKCRDSHKPCQATALKILTRLVSDEAASFLKDEEKFSLIQHFVQVRIYAVDSFSVLIKYFGRWNVPDVLYSPKRAVLLGDFTVSR
jgi:hypothetical protein